MRLITSFAAATLAAAILNTHALAQGMSTMLPAMNIDMLSLSTGYRTSKIVGRTVVNESEDTVGTIDDLIIIPTDREPYAVLAVGGFLGLGTKNVVMPYSSLQEHGKQMLLRNVTTKTLQELPEFKYSD